MAGLPTLIKKISKGLLVGLFVWLLISAHGVALTTERETIIVALVSRGNEPLAFPRDSSETGIYKDLMVAISSITGDTFVYEYYPPKRIMTLFENGDIDISPGISPLWRQTSKVPGCYTVAFAKAEDIVLFSPGNRIPVHSAHDLKGRTLGTMRGYYYPGYMEAFAKGDVKRDYGDTEIELLKMLLNGRFNQVFMRKEVAQYWMKVIPEYQNFEIGDVVGSVEIMLRVHPSKAHVLERFNKAIENLKQSGQIERIYAQYR